MRNQKGFTILEALIAAGIVAIVIAGAVTFMTGVYSTTRKSQDMAFATQKAMQMFEELRAYVQGNKEDPLNNLSNFSDGTVYNHMLTTETGVTNPADALSENIKVGGKWKYVRKITVNAVPNDKNARHVSVIVYYADKDNDSIPRAGIKSLAEISGILKTNIGPVPPTHVYDVYLLTLENIASWWSDQDTLKPIFDQALNDLENRNPGLEFRKHYITRSAFGRDPYYAPYINSTATTSTSDIPMAYFYPGKMTPTNTSAANESYVDEMIQGRKRNDTNFYHIDKSNPDYREYALADQYNHAVRYPEEVAAYERLKSDAIARSVTEGSKAIMPEPSLAMLLEGMNSSSDDYRNIILINLHGELQPLPPLRNYSDAARLLADSAADTTTTYTNIRAVTHPENEYYANSSTVNFRVYGYQITPGTNFNIPNVTLFLPTDNKFGRLNYTAVLADAKNAISVSKYVGNATTVYSKVVAKIKGTTEPTPYAKGVLNKDEAIGSTWLQVVQGNHGILAGDTIQIGDDIDVNKENAVVASVDGANVYLTSPMTKVHSTSLAPYTNPGYPHLGSHYVPVNLVSRPNGPDYDITVNPTIFGQTVNGILITLYNTPTTCPKSTDKTGLDSTQRLYGMDYISCPVTNDFTTYDLTKKDTTSKIYPKNTARWVVSLNLSNLSVFNNQRIDVETRVETNLEDGISMDQDVYRPDDTTTALVNENATVQRTHLKNVSRTYTWVGAKTVPETEKYQFLGDPRYEPYLDAKLAHRYNWFFYKTSGGSTTMTDYGNYDRHQGPKWDNDDADLGRLYALLREGVMSCNGVYNSMTGYTSYYYGIGGEIGGDTNNTLFDIHDQPWYNTEKGTETKSNGDEATINEIIGGTRLIAKTDNTWYCKPWLGELYPDADHNYWITTGNIPTLDYTGADITDRFYRARYDTAMASGPALSLSNRLKRLSTQGCSTLFNGNSDNGASTTFNHSPGDGTATLTSGTGEPGKGLSDGFNLAIPISISASRPFLLNYAGNLPPEWSQTEYSSFRNILRYINSAGTESATPNTSGTTANVYFYRTGDTSKIASSIVKVKRDTDANGTYDKVGYFVVNGLDRQISGDVGAAWMARYSQAATLEAFLDSGDMSVPGIGYGRTVQLPRVVITEPSESTLLSSPASTTIKWTNAWKKWNNSKYAQGYPSNWYDSTKLLYNLKYSTDNGKTWMFVSDNTTAVPGQYDPYHSVFASAETISALTEKSYAWNLSSFGSGNYLVRIEAYRQGMLLTGYSYHQVLFSIER